MKSQSIITDSPITSEKSTLATNLQDVATPARDYRKEMMFAKPKLIIVDSPIGSGKSTLTSKLREVMLNTTLIRESSIENDTAEASYVYHRNIYSLINANIGLGCSFVLDRCHLSQYVYSQMGLKDHDYTEEFKELNGALHELGKEYDLHYICLIVDPKVGAKRIAQRKKAEYVTHDEDMISNQASAYLEAVQHLFLIPTVKVHVINTTNTSAEQVFEQVMKYIG